MKINFCPPSGFHPVSFDTSVMPVPRIGDRVIMLQSETDHFGKPRIPRSRGLEVIRVDYDLSEMCIDVYIND